ncbi:MAG TPA: signal recognition particle-docking protein FtsY [Dehalococcoidia bacterium]|nr:signal recognition particle-docking protein FtsY [Dehalococcoidia bacterium]
MRRPVLFKLFRRKSRDGEEAEPGAESLADQAEARGDADEAALAASAGDEPEADEPPAEAEEGPAFDEEVEERTEEALRPTKRSFFRRMFGVFERSQIDDELWDELEEILILADTGAETTEKILAAVQERVRKEGMKQPEEARDALKDELVAVLSDVDDRGQLWGGQDGDGVVDGRAFQPAVILVVGVNGVGKTTSIAKLARAFRRDGERVILAAGDTFRAAAIEQLKLWGERVGAPVIAHQQGQDASAVVFDAMAAAKKRSADVVLVDTAGRLHSKSNLMEELKKINRVVQRLDETAPHEVLLVLDAVTGQNGLAQAKTFAEAVGVTAIFLTKLDGTAKGGIVFAIADQLGIPVRFIGTGEKADDMAPFDPEGFVDALFAE